MNFFLVHRPLPLLRLFAFVEEAGWQPLCRRLWYCIILIFLLFLTFSLGSFGDLVIDAPLLLVNAFLKAFTSLCMLWYWRFVVCFRPLSLSVFWIASSSFVCRQCSSFLRLPSLSYICRSSMCVHCPSSLWSVLRSSSLSVLCPPSLRSFLCPLSSSGLSPESLSFLSRASLCVLRSESSCYSCKMFRVMDPMKECFMMSTLDIRWHLLIIIFMTTTSTKNLSFPLPCLLYNFDLYNIQSWRYCYCCCYYLVLYMKRYYCFYIYIFLL